ncbi:hypothetical protein APHWI1_0041 [Anaplasma phagocytophilum str. ApWI1]|uniref:Uncharacterized protein n=1 Tax=Anaplasma phagocytophilum str. ApWI1 TaxID=1359155 RepID=A0A0F3PYW8_ANAPH|nr:hypothetical protein APHWEB_1469 [Anaplasma phagocytophilum str. Webster]KJV84399.1 hypothetical protein APHWI1_0041 [Anaplasma phagocytophilum str. ApWI1]KJV98931.1 hypothetical protein OTSANNIE_0810 [Anaplasma phagocytophilum str. Annie]KJZ98416.1 hypothetical protein APHCR_0070 [Anaplasma phagocytophilum str. CR1007]
MIALKNLLYQGAYILSVTYINKLPKKSVACRILCQMYCSYGQLGDV